MSQLATYNRIFTETFLIMEDKLPGFTYQDTAEWDSVGHMTMIAAMEEAFDIMMDTDDIIDFSSYEKGIEVLKKYDVVI
ncbi:acyl carrier protein [Pectobacterium carotovorum]|uniref:acyl carrier protein n=1 Tax=Pectobacterium carotovorum TaxID=554 RepID=UPI0015DE6E9A|nr:acyl carrier protein [Pectobacterium carotovorum]MBA0180420.1 acyl carrier protein [Pectobacterium carotovorum]